MSDESLVSSITRIRYYAVEITKFNVYCIKNGFDHNQHTRNNSNSLKYWAFIYLAMFWYALLVPIFLLLLVSKMLELCIKYVELQNSTHSAVLAFISLLTILWFVSGTLASVLSFIAIADHKLIDLII